MALIDAYRKDTGEKVRIPGHWLDDPTLAEPFSKTPRQKARDRASGSAKAGDTPPAPAAEE